MRWRSCSTISTTSRTTLCFSIWPSWCRPPRSFSWGGELAEHGQRSVWMTTLPVTPSANPSERHRRKLLILENDRALRRELEQIFSDLEVTVGETSDQALVILRR